METKDSDIVYVKVRIERELHEKLKKVAQTEKRSMNYLLNKSVEVLLTLKSREI